MAEVEQPIIIKKITIEEGGHHGGAWKVAYADFVTAMMAFFLLLWLLSTSSKETLEGISDYFTPTMGVKDAKGIGFEGGRSPVEDGSKKSDLMPPGVVVGSVPQGPTATAPEKSALLEADQDANLFEKAEVDFKKAIESDPNLNELTDSNIVEQSPEGMKLELRDSDKNAMFEPDSAMLSEYGRMLLAKMKDPIEQMPNHISITGHTEVKALPPENKQYTSWELSADRANAARRFLLSAGMIEDRVSKVVGRGDQEPLEEEDPKSPKNRRITIIFLRSSHLNIPLSQQPAARPLLSVPSAEDIQTSPQQRRQKHPAKKEEPQKELPGALDGKPSALDLPNALPGHMLKPGEQPPAAPVAPSLNGSVAPLPEKDRKPAAPAPKPEENSLPAPGDAVGSAEGVHPVENAPKPPAAPKPAAASPQAPAAPGLNDSAIPQRPEQAPKSQ